MQQRKLHPAYGLTDEVRLTILRAAELHGVALAAELHNVSVSSIYNWGKHYERNDNERVC